MNRLNLPLGLLFDFHEVKPVAGISRLLLAGANEPRTEGREGNEAREPSLRRRLEKARKSQDRLDHGLRLSPTGAAD